MWLLNSEDARLMGVSNLDLDKKPKENVDSFVVNKKCHISTCCGQTALLPHRRQRKRRDSNGHTTYQRFLHRFSGRRREDITEEPSFSIPNPHSNFDSNSRLNGDISLSSESLNLEARVRDHSTCLIRTNKLGNVKISIDHTSHRSINLESNSSNSNSENSRNSEKNCNSDLNRIKDLSCSCHLKSANRDKISPKVNSRCDSTVSSRKEDFCISSLWRWRTKSKAHTSSSLRTLLLAALFILSTCCVTLTDACSSRTTPKPRPPITPISQNGGSSYPNIGGGGNSGSKGNSNNQNPNNPNTNTQGSNNGNSGTTPSRPNITFHTYVCPPDYAIWYCLNGATCFTVKIGESLLYNCECADGFMGPRCEYKDLDGSYLPSQKRFMLETASIAGGASVAALAFAALCAAAYVHIKKQRKLNRVHQEQEGEDCIDGFSEVITRTRRPREPTFGRRNQSPAAGDCHASNCQMSNLTHSKLTLLPPKVINEVLPKRNTAGDA